MVMDGWTSCACFLAGAFFWEGGGGGVYEIDR